MKPTNWDAGGPAEGPHLIPPNGSWVPLDPVVWVLPQPIFAPNGQRGLGLGWWIGLGQKGYMGG